MAIFVDTGAWFAYFVRRDPDHSAAVEWMRGNRQPLVTTDSVFDELVTPLALRESRHVAVAAGDLLWTQQVADLKEVAQGDLAEAWDVFRRYQDKEWSFTDCTSKVVIARLGITEAFAFDHHVEQIGTVTRVP
jgi:hypothetical protein